MTQALIKSSLSRADLRLLVIVNPDAAARGRVINLARAAIRRNTRVMELGVLSDFAGMLEETPEQRRRRGSETVRLHQAIQELRGDVAELRDDWEAYGVESYGDEIQELDRRVGELEGYISE